MFGDKIDYRYIGLLLSYACVPMYLLYIARPVFQNLSATYLTSGASKSSILYYAFKINRGIIREGMEKRVWDEVRIHSQLKHPRIVEVSQQELLKNCLPC